jgi:hypothetical protein
MRVTSMASCVLLAAATVVPCFVIPAKRVISVGDDASAVRAFTFYGYATTEFSMGLTSRRLTADGRRLTTTFFRSGDQWHLQIWHDSRIESMMHFECVPHKNTYSDRIHRSDIKSFTISRATLTPYFVGLAVSFAIGWADRRFGHIYPVVLAIVLLLVIFSSLMMATFFLLLSVGWAAAFLFGANIFQSPQAKASGSRKGTLAEMSEPATGHP